MKNNSLRLLALLLCTVMLFHVPVVAKAGPPTTVSITSEAELVELCRTAGALPKSRLFIAEFYQSLEVNSSLTIPENLFLDTRAPLTFRGDLVLMSSLTVHEEVILQGALKNLGIIDIFYDNGGRLSFAQPEHYSDTSEDMTGKICVKSVSESFPEDALVGIKRSDFMRTDYYESEDLPYWILSEYTGTALPPQHTVVTEPGLAPTCLEYGYTEYSYCSVCGEILVPREQLAPLGHTYMSPYDTDCETCGAVRVVDPERPTLSMYRLYNPNSGEHFYTGSEQERDHLRSVGWKYEGVGFTFPYLDPRPVYRLYDKYNTCEHLYTMDEEEKERLLAEGWVYEGIAFNSSIKEEVPQYRLHNPNATIGAYHFTASEEEKDMLIAAGWEYQGIGWYSLGA